MSRRVIEVLSRFTPDLEIYSIDEAFLGLNTFGAHLEGHAQALPPPCFNGPGYGVRRHRAHENARQGYAQSNRVVSTPVKSRHSMKITDIVVAIDSIVPYPYYYLTRSTCDCI
jgi:nucleotidyltransferase/DNA polymerase involved in DNA repair